jgi:RNA polymerase sigma-70 factor (ECF subfamily)
MRAELILTLLRMLEQLPSDQREAIRLRYFESRSLECIARQMQKSLPAVAGLLKRGLRSLRNQVPAATGEGAPTNVDGEERRP